MKVFSWEIPATVSGSVEAEDAEQAAVMVKEITLNIAFAEHEECEANFSVCCDACPATIELDYVI